VGGTQFLGRRVAERSVFLRSMGDRDAHRDAHSGVCSPASRSVHVACDVEFIPRKLGPRGDRLALPGFATRSRVSLTTCAGR
jgi:hypothetical protein